MTDAGTSVLSRLLPTGFRVFETGAPISEYKNDPNPVGGAVHSGRGELVGPAGIERWRWTLVNGPKAFDCGPGSCPGSRMPLLGTRPYPCVLNLLNRSQKRKPCFALCSSPSLARVLGSRAHEVIAVARVTYS
jgi:hypothetical protein